MMLHFHSFLPSFHRYGWDVTFLFECTPTKNVSNECSQEVRDSSAFYLESILFIKLPFSMNRKQRASTEIVVGSETISSISIARLEDWVSILRTPLSLFGVRRNFFIVNAMSSISFTATCWRCQISQTYVSIHSLIFSEQAKLKKSLSSSNHSFIREYIESSCYSE